MAIIKCPECGRTVSDQASSCPDCAYPLGQLKSNGEVSILINTLCDVYDTETGNLLWELPAVSGLAVARQMCKLQLKKPTLLEFRHKKYKQCTFRATVEPNKKYQMLVVSKGILFNKFGLRECDGFMTVGV